MYTFFRFTALLGLFFFTYCSNGADATVSQNNSVHTRVIEQETNQEVNLSDLVQDDIDAIVLDTDPAALFGQIDKIVEYDGRFYVLDRHITQSVKAFDSDGQFLFLVGASGEGPGKYGRPQDILVDEANRQVVVLGNSMIHFYDATDGSYLKQDLLEDFSFTRFAKVDDRWYFQGGQSYPRLLITDTDYEVVEAYFADDPRKNLSSPFTSFHPTDDGLLFQRNFDNTLYKIEDKTVKNWLSVRFDTPPLLEDDLQKEPIHLTQYVIDELSYEKKIMSKYFFDTPTEWTFGYLSQGKYYLSVCRKSENTCYAMDGLRLKNDLLTDAPIVPVGTTAAGEYLILLNAQEIQPGKLAVLPEADQAAIRATPQANLLLKFKFKEEIGDLLAAL